MKVQFYTPSSNVRVLVTTFLKLSTVRIFFWLHRVACGILVPWPEIEPPPGQWKCQVLTTGPPGNSFFWGTVFLILVILLSVKQHLILVFNTHFPDDWWCWAPFHVLIDYSHMNIHIHSIHILYICSYIYTYTCVCAYICLFRSFGCVPKWMIY